MAETLGKIPRKVESFIAHAPLSSFSKLRKAWLPVLGLECALFLYLGFEEIMWQQLSIFLHLSNKQYK